MVYESNEAISSRSPFDKKSVDVLGSKIAFVDVGSSRSTTLVFLHGNPTSSYLWRNIIPYVADRARCIAPDLIGFGDSDKVPGLSYRVEDHQRYLDAFLDKVIPRGKIILVVHDWGSALGFDWARRNEHRVAGLAFMEFLPPVDRWDEFSQGFTHMFQQFRDPKIGRKLLIDENVFIERVLQGGIIRQLGEQELKEYRRPFMEPESREPLYRFPNELPIQHHPAAVWEKAQKYMAWLYANDLPKLFFWVTPGTFIGEARAKELMEKLRNTKSIYLGQGRHFVQEDHPHAIGRGLSEWLPLNAEGLL